MVEPEYNVSVICNDQNKYHALKVNLNWETKWNMLVWICIGKKKKKKVLKYRKRKTDLSNSPLCMVLPGGGEYWVHVKWFGFFLEVSKGLLAVTEPIIKIYC